MRMQFRSILCATDFSEHSNRTIPYGVAIAREFGATLHLCHVIDLTALTIYGEFQIDPVGQQTRIRQEANEQLEKMLKPHRIRWESLIAVGQPAAVGEQLKHHAPRKQPAVSLLALGPDKDPFISSQLFGGGLPALDGERRLRADVDAGAAERAALVHRDGLRSGGDRPKRAGFLAQAAEIA